MKKSINIYSFNSVLDRKLDLRPMVLLVVFPHQAKAIFELSEKHTDMTLIVPVANP